VSLEADKYLGVVCLLNSAHAEILVDVSDLPLLGRGRWTVTKSRWGQYAVKQIDSVRWQLHRLILGAQAGQVVDHINRDGLDNRRVNLRLCTPTQNNANQAVRADSHSGLKGAYLHNARSSKPWRAAIKVGGRRRYLGTYHRAEDAHAAYCAAAAEVFGEFARTE
jgi:hypothetical protein